MAMRELVGQRLHVGTTNLYGCRTGGQRCVPVATGSSVLSKARYAPSLEAEGGRPTGRPRIVAVGQRVTRPKPTVPALASCWVMDTGDVGPCGC